MPWIRLNVGKLDLCLSFIQITITVGLASFTIVQCRSRWQFFLLAVWKLTMSATVGFWCIWASLKVIKNKGIAYKPCQESGGYRRRQRTETVFCLRIQLLDADHLLPEHDRWTRRNHIPRHREHPPTAGLDHHSRLRLASGFLRSQLYSSDSVASSAALELQQ
jgi:hypothetical protein